MHFKPKGAPTFPAQVGSSNTVFPGRDMVQSNWDTKETPIPTLAEGTVHQSFPSHASEPQIHTQIYGWRSTPIGI